MTPAGLLLGNAKPGPVKVVNTEEQPVDLSAQASLEQSAFRRRQPLRPPAADQAKPSGGSDPTALAATGNTPLVAPPGASAAVHAVGIPRRRNRCAQSRCGQTEPRSRPILRIRRQATRKPRPAAPPQEAPKASRRRRPLASDWRRRAVDAKARIADQAFAASRRRGSAVGKTDTTAPGRTPRRPPSRRRTALRRSRKRRRRSPKPRKSSTRPKRPERSRRRSTRPPRRPPGGWSVQLAAPKSEAEAKSEVARLTSKYSAELNGSPIGVHKAEVNGETIYRLRVSGLTKADAAAMCARLKGEGGQCFIVK